MKTDYQQLTAEEILARVREMKRARVDLEQALVLRRGAVEDAERQLDYLLNDQKIAWAALKAKVEAE